MRVLFVDDEPGILDGLRNALRRERQRWQMVFTSSGDAALAEIRQQRFDMIISDMRMPHMDGATLLAQASVLQPGTARVVLSGHAERGAIIRALPVAHQYLSKPCDVSTLHALIDGVDMLSQLCPDAKLRDTLGAINCLPSSRAAFIAIRKAALDPDLVIATVSSIVERDVAMSAKLLQLAKSAFFGEGRLIHSVREAVHSLGLDLLRRLVLDADIINEAVCCEPEFLPRAIEISGLPAAVGLLAEESGLLSGSGQTSRATLTGRYLLSLWGIQHLHPTLHDAKSDADSEAVS